MTVIYVSTGAELTAALNVCNGGEHIIATQPIAEHWIVGKRFDVPVTITGTFRASFANAEGSFQLFNCKGITLLDCDFVGMPKDASGFYPRNRSLLIHDCEDVLVERCRVGKGWQGCFIYRTYRFAFVECDFLDVGPFGIQVSYCHGGRIAECRFERFRINHAAGDHADAIMLHTGPDWGPGSEWSEQGSTDIEIVDNLIIGDLDNKPQGIFVRDAGGGLAQGFPFRNFLVKGNEVLCCMWGGIAVENCVGARVIENYVATVIGGLTPAGGDVTDSWIELNCGPGNVTELRGNSAALLLLDGKLVTDERAGVVDVPNLTLAQLAERKAVWMAKHRPAAQPTPAPAPTPVPSPVPPPAPIADNLLRYATKAEAEARTMMNTGRRLHAAALKTLEAVQAR